MTFPRAYRRKIAACFLWRKGWEALRFFLQSSLSTLQCCKHSARKLGTPLLGQVLRSRKKQNTSSCARKCRAPLKEQEVLTKPGATPAANAILATKVLFIGVMLLRLNTPSSVAQVATVALALFLRDPRRVPRSARERVTICCTLGALF